MATRAFSCHTRSAATSSRNLHSTIILGRFIVWISRMGPLIGLELPTDYNRSMQSILISFYWVPTKPTSWHAWDRCGAPTWHHLEPLHRPLAIARTTLQLKSSSLSTALGSGSQMANLMHYEYFSIVIVHFFSTNNLFPS